VPRNPATTHLYHITDASNLPSIIASGALLSDVAVSQINHRVIGYDHIKQRRMTENRVPCCGNRFVGEFVPFYFCPRSPMLFVINNGRTGLPAGCQTTIVHLVTTVSAAVQLGRPYAISDGNAGAGYTTYRSDLQALDDHLDWGAINAKYWSDKAHFKSAEFLVADRFEWHAISAIGCHNTAIIAQVNAHLAQATHKPTVKVESSWYYR
jgi:hypothetical protein